MTSPSPSEPVRRLLTITVLLNNDLDQTQCDEAAEDIFNEVFDDPRVAGGNYELEAED